MMTRARSRRQAIEWLLIKHEESGEAIEATRGALECLRHVKRGIPTPEVQMAACEGIAASDDAESDDGDETRVDGSGGIMKGELASAPRKGAFASAFIEGHLQAPL